MCSLFRLPAAKTTIGQILTFGGLRNRTPFTDKSQIWCAIAGPWCISSGSVYAVALWWWKTLIFAVCWTLAFNDVDRWRHSKKGEHGCTTTTLPLSNGIRIVSVLQRLHGDIWRTNSDVQKRDEQIDKQKTQRFGRPGGGWNPRATKLGTVIEDLKRVLALLKLFGSHA